ncbi:MAG: RluA family pseudouridine synthase [Candidatus Omnitrophica bacterium]|nr:RluA family pseudouridine synthase [Candidatus Omnitrophota bacterium]
MRIYHFSVGISDTGLRIDRYLTRRLPMSVSRSMIQRGIRAGLVIVGERPVKAHDKLHAGDRVVVTFAELPAPSRHVAIQPQAIPLEIVYEDADMLVVNKPAGLVTHPAPGHWDGTLVNAILWHMNRAQGSRLKAQGHSLQPPASSLQPPLTRAGIIHRLDKDTSGLLMVAKTEAAHLSLARQLKAHTIRRRYLALVEGHLPSDTGTINAPIGRHMTHRKVMTVRHLGGRGAVTHYRVLKRFGKAFGARGSGLRAVAQSPEPRTLSDFSYTLIEVSLETGRTHQIRVHLAHLGYPVLGDTTYGRHPATFWQAFGISRQLLHAYHVSCQHPATGRRVALAAPIPDDLARWFPPGLMARGDEGSDASSS